MAHIKIRDITSGKIPVGETVSIAGWIRTRRGAGSDLAFLNVHDGTCHAALQVVAKSALANFDTDIAKLSAGCAVIVVGTIVPSQGKGQNVELDANDVAVVGWVEDPLTYPMQPKRHTREFLRENAHLRPRTNLIGAVTRVRNSLAQAIHRYFHENTFYWIHTPIITSSDAEGAGQMFRVSTLDLENLPRDPKGGIDFGKDFFARETFLTVSGQLSVENYCLAMSRVYTFGPTFRAENSNTTRHLAEFWMVEPEIAFADLNDDAQLAEDFLRYTINAALTECADDMAFFNKFVDKTALARLQRFVDSPFKRLEYTEAVSILKQSGKSFQFPVSWGEELQTEHERYLTEEHFKAPVIVMNYPKDVKAFYMRVNDDNKTVAAMDVLAPGIGEIIGGSQREERLDVLDSRIESMGLEPDHYWWYRDLRKYGTVPHAGFGLGFDRLVSYVTGVDNIRDVTPFPRTPRNADF